MSVVRARPKSEALLLHYRELREAGASPMRRREAYNAWFRQRCKEGNNPSALKIHSKDEAERFWARTVAGSDGHIYWTAGKVFISNGGSKRIPQRWAWGNTHGELGNYTEIQVVCGERSCVNPEHMEIRPRAESRTRFTDAQIYGALQVLAMRLGRAPTKDDWDAAKLPIGSRAVTRRHDDSWGKALRAAGLEPRPYMVTNSTVCEEAIVALAAKIGHRPSRRDWDDNREWLAERGYPTSSTTLRNQLNGSFVEVVDRVLDRRAA